MPLPTHSVLRTEFDGMDGSHHQPDAGPMDLSKTRGAPSDWIAWKCSQSTAYVDPTFHSVREQVTALGFRHRLFYHWLSSTTDPAMQATHYLNKMRFFAPGEGVMLDAEEAGITVDKCLVWLEAVEEITKRPSSVYTGLYVAGGTIWKSQRIRDSKYGPRPMHLAAYVSVTSLVDRINRLGVQGLPLHAWQWSSNGPVPGITGRCDMNQVLDLAAYDLCTGYVEPVPPIPIPTPQEGASVLVCFYRFATNGGIYKCYSGGYKVWCPTKEDYELAKALAPANTPYYDSTDSVLLTMLGPILGPRPANTNEYGYPF